MSEGEFRDQVFSRLDAIDERLRRRDPIRSIALVVAALCLLAAGGAFAYAISGREALNDQLDTNQLVLCAQARSVAAASAFRSRRVNETHEEFLNRMLAQRFQLLAVGDLMCPDLPGFATFAYLRGKAINEINDILRRLAPKRFREIAEHESQMTASPADASSPPIATTTLPPPSSLPGVGGDTGKPDPPSSPGGSHGGSGAPPRGEQPSKPPQGDDGPTVIVNPPPASPPNPPSQPPPQELLPEPGQQSVLSPTLDQTCQIGPLGALLCIPQR